MTTTPAARDENKDFDSWRKEQIASLIRMGYPDAARAFNELGSVQWAGWQARSALAESELAELRAELAVASRRFSQMVDYVEEIAQLRKSLNECAAALPGVEHMDLPDGGSPSIGEQVRRMAEELNNCRIAYGLLREIGDHCNGCVMPTEELLRDWGKAIDALLSSAEPAKGGDGEVTRDE